MECFFCKEKFKINDKIYKIVPCFVLYAETLEYNRVKEAFVCHENCLLKNNKTEKICNDAVERNNILDLLVNNE
jgi:hypothetical protein